MKRGLFTFALAALTIGLLGSCSKINERIDGLDNRVYDLENEKIASVEQQIAAINQSIADLETIRTNIQNLKNEQEAQGQDITALKAADITLEGKINDLKTYVDTELSKYSTKDWANATFATLEQHQWTCDTIAKIDARIGALDAKLSQSISGLENSLKKWVNEQLDAYYTAAQMDAKLGVMQSEIDALKNSKDSERIDSLATELTKTKAAVDTAKANIRTEYKNAIDVAINKLDGEIRGALLDSIAAVNARIEALDTRVTTLEGKVLALEGKVDKLLAMIQSVSITPAYSDGSVEAVDGILTLKCIVSPAEALIGMESLKDSLVLYADSVKVKTKATTPAYMTIKVSEASVLDAAQGAITLTADISEYLPKGEDKALTVAVNIKNGISDYTTEFVPVYVAEPVLPAGALPGVFSVSATKKVHFSQGNLVATIEASGAPTAWKFAAHQYDCLGEGGANKTIGSAEGDVDLFGWSTSSNGGTSTTDNYGIKTSTTASDYSGEFYDWGEAVGDGSTWRTLSIDEWLYLFKKRTDASNKVGYATVGEVNGIIILPDTFTDPKKNGGSGAFVPKSTTGWTANIYTTGGDWDAMESAGAVFLPAAGYRNGANVSNVVTYGLYWSSSVREGSNEACHMIFGKGSFYDEYSNRFMGYSVRLVTE